MQHGAGAGIEWVAVIKCVGCGMQHPCTPPRRLEISTQKAKNGRKGRDSNSRRLKISTQTAEIGRKGRESRTSLSEISTQTAEISRKG